MKMQEFFWYMDQLNSQAAVSTCGFFVVVVLLLLFFGGGVTIAAKNQGRLLDHAIGQQSSCFSSCEMGGFEVEDSGQHESCQKQDRRPPEYGHQPS